MDRREYDLAIIGAGPAGMSAAHTASEKGLKVVLLDEQPSPGGQIYRGIKYAPIKNKGVLGKDYYVGSDLLKEFERCSVEYISNAMVWSIDESNKIAFSENGQSRLISAKKVLVATGAQERSMPFEGWTLPGVMTCGAAQILLKTSGITPKGPLVLAGNGPLLLLIAVQLMRAGVEIEAILDTSEKGNLAKALPYFLGALKNLPLLIKGIGLLKTVKQSNIKLVRHVSSLKAVAGDDGNIESVAVTVNGKVEQITCRNLLIHQGVVPNVQMSRALQLEHAWDALQYCWKPVTDLWGQSSRDNIFIAGDGAGISGAIAAQLKGQLAALRIVGFIKGETEQHEFEMSRTLKALNKQLAIRPFIDALYAPSKHFLVPQDDTIVCRCEEVTAGEIRQSVNDGSVGPNQTKSFCRSGMGPCQGRMCGLTVSHLISDALGVSESEVGYYNIRMPIKPLSINELADLAEDA